MDEKELETFKTSLDAAEKGDVNAMFELYHYYSNGFGVEPDEQKGNEMAEKGSG